MLVIHIGVEDARIMKISWANEMKVHFQLRNLVDHIEINGNVRTCSCNLYTPNVVHSIQNNYTTVHSIMKSEDHDSSVSLTFKENVLNTKHFYGLRK